jgi:hypothetical protein
VQHLKFADSRRVHTAMDLAPLVLDVA